MVCKVFCIIFFFLAGLPGYAQLFPKRHFRTQDGLVQKQITCLLEDSHGAMWIGTKGGVSRFDGNNIDAYTVQNGLEQNGIRALTEDMTGGILVFSDTGIARIKNGQVKVLSSGKFFQLVNAINDTSGYTYFLTLSKEMELGIVEPQGQVSTYPFFTKFGRIPKAIWKNSSNKEVWLKDDNGDFYRLANGEAVLVHTESKPPYLQGPTVPNDSLMTVWSSLFVNSANSSFLPFEKENIRAVYQPAGGWFYFDQRDFGTLHLQTASGTEKINYPFIYINILFVDSRKQVWVGTEDGLVVFHHLLFRNYINKKLIPNPWSIVEGGDGAIYIGNYGSELVRIENGSISGDIIPFEDRQDEADRHALSHFYHGGVRGFADETYFNTSRGVLTLQQATLRRTIDLPREPVYASFHDSLHHRILFSVFKQGIYAWTQQHVLTQILKLDHPAFQRIYCMALDRSGRLLLGSENAVAIMDEAGFRIFKDQAGDSIRGAFSIARDSRSSIWFGNDYGLYHYDGTRISKIQHEFLNQSVRALQLLPENNLLIGTSKGIGVLFIDTLLRHGSVRLKWYDFRNGYEGGEVSINGFYQDRHGKVWIAGANGVIRMDPNWIRLDSIPVEASIREVFAGTRKSDWLQVFPDTSGVVRMNHEVDHIRINFSSINVKSPMRDYYQYRLIGHDDHWSVPTADLFAVYNNLKPGTYHFEIRVRNKDDLWNPVPTRLHIEIIPAWYQKLAFKLLLFILILVIIVLITNLVTRRTQRIKINRILRENEIAKLKLEAIRNQLEPHFVFNVLNSIGYAIRANETDTAYEYLTKFSGLLRRWLKGSDESLATLESELDLVREYLDLEKFRFEDRLNYSIEMDADVSTDLKIPRMILQIPVENAVKHGISNLPEGGRISIKVINWGPGIRIRIEDNGIGRTAAAKRSSAGNQKGMKIMERMLSQIRDFQDYNVNYQVIDLFDQNMNPSGTAVEISIEFK